MIQHWTPCNSDLHFVSSTNHKLQQEEEKLSADESSLLVRVLLVRPSPNPLGLFSPSRSVSFFFNGSATLEQLRPVDANSPTGAGCLYGVAHVAFRPAVLLACLFVRRGSAVCRVTMEADPVWFRAVPLGVVSPGLSILMCHSSQI